MAHVCWRQLQTGLLLLALAGNWSGLLASCETNTGSNLTSSALEINGQRRSELSAVNTSDTEQIAQALGLTYWIWGALLALVSLGIVALGLWRAIRLGRGDAVAQSSSPRLQ